jgi:hypothetical protein
MYIDDIVWVCQENWPSLERIDRWIGREDHAILENGHAQIGVSEYCGLVAVWIVPAVSDYFPEHAGLAHHWISQIEDRFRERFGRLRSLGFFSNGEQVFQRTEEENANGD